MKLLTGKAFSELLPVFSGMRNSFCNYWYITDFKKNTILKAMVSKYEVSELIEAELYKIRAGFHSNYASANIYKSVECLTDCTKQAVQDHNFNLSKKCFLLAERLYANGDSIIKSAIENTFIYSFSSLMPDNKIEKLILKSIIPVTLYAVYMKQVMQSGC
jgi:hypothetical protein